MAAARRAAAAPASFAPSGSRPRSCGRLVTNRLIGSSTNRVIRPSAQQAPRQPSFRMIGLQPRQDQDGADADAGESQPGRQRAAAHEPVGQVLRLHGEAHAVRPRAHQHAQGRVELPRLADHRGAQQARRRQHDADLDHEARPTPVHGPADDGADHGGDQEAEGEGARRQAAIPAELVDDGREHQREGRAGGYAHRDSQEGDQDDHPAEEERQARRERPGSRGHLGRRHRYFLYPFRQPHRGFEGAHSLSTEPAPGQ